MKVAPDLEEMFLKRIFRVMRPVRDADGNLLYWKALIPNKEGKTCAVPSNAAVKK